jgi:hypothetical protein
MQLREIEDIWLNLSQVTFFERNQHGKNKDRLVLYMANGMTLIIEGVGVPAFLERLEAIEKIEQFPDCDVRDTPISKRLFS